MIDRSINDDSCFTSMRTIDIGRYLKFQIQPIKIKKKYKKYIHI